MTAKLSLNPIQKAEIEEFGITFNSNEVTYAYEQTVTTKDDIIFQQEFPRKAYFMLNQMDIGHGLKDNYTVYAGGNYFYFTLPHTIIQ